MKAIFEFNLPEDNYDFQVMNNASKYYSALQDFAQNVIRKNLKYNDKLTEEQFKVWEEVERNFYEILEEQNIHLWD